MLQYGKINKLKIISLHSKFIELEGGVQLPLNSQRPCHLGENVEVFVYTANQNLILGTWRVPFALVDEFAYLRVVEILEIGAFLDMGIEKHLFVPTNQQKIKMELNRSYLVRLCLDQKTNKIYGTTKFHRFLEKNLFDITKNQKVSLLPFEYNDYGVKVIINNRYNGIIYNNEIFSKVELGKKIPGYIKEIRPDGLIDAAIRPIGIKNLNFGKKEIIEALKKSNGFLPLHDKSSPEEIKKILEMSKQTFKRAIGMLYKERKIIINKDGIKLTK